MTHSPSASNPHGIAARTSPFLTSLKSKSEVGYFGNCAVSQTSLRSAGCETHRESCSESELRFVRMTYSGFWRGSLRNACLSLYILCRGWGCCPSTRKQSLDDLWFSLVWSQLQFLSWQSLRLQAATLGMKAVWSDFGWESVFSSRLLPTCWQPFFLHLN